MDHRLTTIRIWFVGLVAFAGMAVTCDPMLMMLPPLAGFWCCCGGCTSNCSPTFTGGWEIDIAGITTDTNCANCTLFDQLYVLPADSALPTNKCRWQLTGSDLCTEVQHSPMIEVDVAQTAGLDYILEVDLHFGQALGFPFDAGNSSKWVFNNGTSPIDCGAVSALDVPFHSHINGFDSFRCNGSGSICTATAI